MSDRFEYDSDGDVAKLKSISFWSISALALAVISFFYLINTQLVGVPILAFIFSVIAIIRIASDENLTGAWIAIVALFLATFVFTTSVTYRQFKHQYLIGVADKHCRLWLDMVKDGDIYKTHQLTYAYPDRQDITENLETYYARTTPPQFGEDRAIYLELDHYTTVEPEFSIRNDGAACELINEGLVFHNDRNKRENFTFRYRLKRADKSQGDRIFQIQMRRTRHYPPLGPQWNVSALENINPPIERKLPRIDAPQ